MTDDVKAKIEAATKRYKDNLRKFANDYLLPVLQDVSN